MNDPLGEIVYKSNVQSHHLSGTGSTKTGWLNLSDHYRPVWLRNVIELLHTCLQSSNKNMQTRENTFSALPHTLLFSSSCISTLYPQAGLHTCLTHLSVEIVNRQTYNTDNNLQERQFQAPHSWKLTLIIFTSAPHAEGQNDVRNRRILSLCTCIRLTQIYLYFMNRQWLL